MIIFNIVHNIIVKAINYVFISYSFTLNRDIKKKIQQAEQEVIDSSTAYNNAKEKHLKANEAFSSKQREWRSVTNKMKRLEDDINLLKKEIKKLERQGKAYFRNIVFTFFSL